MARIILNVEANTKTAIQDVDKLRQSVIGIGNALKNVKADKDLTAQIQALTKWNKSLADAVTKVTKANDQQAKSELQLERYRSQTIIRAKQQLAEGEERIARQRAKNAQETAKLHIQEERLAREQQRTAQATRENTDEIDRQNAKTTNLIDAFSKFRITSRLLYSGLRLLRNAIKDVNETLADTEKRIIAIQRVLPENSVGDQDLANRLYDLAIKYGQSFANVSDVATAFARSGQSYEETIKSTEAALVALNVAELDATQATDGMIAIMAQFGLEASEMLSVVDKLDKVADRFPVTTEKLLAALQRMGSSASLAGLSLDETIGIATTLSKATGRSGANIGTAANALIQYSTKEKALNTYASLSPEVAAIVAQYKIGAANVLDIWKALSKEINNLTYEQSEKLDVLADYFESGEGAGLKEELESELGDIFNDISGVFSTANTFRKNYFVSLLKGIDTVGEAAQTALTSEGYAIQENEKEMQTYERRVASLKAQWHKLANDEQGFLAFKKGLVDVGSTILSIMEWTGGLRTAVIALGSAFLTLFGTTILTKAKEFLAILVGMNGAMSAALGWIGLALTAVSAIVGVIQQYKQAQHEANLETIEAWKQSKESTLQLQQLYDEYKKLNPESEEFRSVEAQIVQLLDDKTGILDTLTKGTDEYSKAVEHLTETELRNRMVSASAAAKATEKELAAVGRIQSGSQTGDVAALDALGLYDDGMSLGEAYNALYGEVNGLKGKNYTLNMYKLAQRRLAQLKEQIRKSNENGNYDRAEAIKNSGIYADLDAFIKNNGGLVDDYIEATAALYLDEFLTNQGINAITTADQLSSAKSFVGSRFTSKNGGDLFAQYYSDIYKVIDSYARVQTVGEKTTEKQKNSLEDIGSEYSKIADEIDGLLSKNQKVNEKLEKQKALEEAIAKAKADYIKSAFDEYLNGLEVENTISEKQQSIEEARAKVEEARLAVEEKRQAVKEAEYNLQKAQDDLEYARNNRSERVFNATTGMWEYQANKKNVEAAQEKVRQATEKVENAVKTVDSSIKDVEKAEQNVQKAIDSLTDYLKKQAIAEIKDAITDGIDDGKVAEILQKWFGEGEGGEWGAGIKGAISSAIAGASVAAASNAAVITAQQALDTYQQDQFYSAISSLFTGSDSINVNDVNAIIEEYRKRGVSEDAISAVRGIVNKYVDGDLWGGKVSNTNPFLVSGIISGTGVIGGKGWGTPYYDSSFLNRNGSNTTNNSYTVNGIPIAKDVAERYTLAEIFNNFDLVH